MRAAKIFKINFRTPRLKRGLLGINLVEIIPLNRLDEDLNSFRQYSAKELLQYGLTEFLTNGSSRFSQVRQLAKSAELHYSRKKDQKNVFEITSNKYSIFLVI